MFWGVTILGGRRYTQTVEKSYHISKAALEIPIDGKVSNKRVQLMLETEGNKYLLCNLDGDKLVQVDLDLIFTEGEEVTFFLSGEGTVHLSGYQLDFEEDEFDDEFDDEESEEEETELANAGAKRLLKGAAGPAAAKKTKVEKVTNGVDKDEESDDSDDDILGALDKEFDSDDEDDEEDEEEDDEEDDEEDLPVAPKVVPKVNGQTPKQKLKETPAKNQQNQPQKNQASAGKQNNQQKGQAGQQKAQNSPQGQKPFGQNQKGGQQQQKGGQLNANKQQQFNKQKGSFTPDAKDGKKKATYPGGLQVDDVHEGHGPEARKGKFVHVRYVGRLPNNKEFDRSTNKPFSFKLGSGQVIKGWDLGVEGMKVGGKRKLVVPPNMGYGNRSMGPIPSNSTLHFEVELVSVS